MSKAARYVVITPVRDEESRLGQTVRSMAAQTLLPAEWIIVNDGSTDGTGAVADEAARSYPWIRALHRENRGFRKSGGGVVETFDTGYRALATGDWHFLVKLDGDLSFAPDYFQRMFAHFASDPQLGIGGGGIYHPVEGELKLERTPAFHVRGATKIYRRACWEAIGGLIAAPGWDTLDEVKANMLGWRTKCFEDLQLIHHKHTGSADGTWGAWVKNGRGSYIAGYHPLYMVLKCAKRVLRRPVLVGSAGLLYGYVSGYLSRSPQVADRALIRYLRQQQLNRLLLRESIWK